MSVFVFFGISFLLCLFCVVVCELIQNMYHMSVCFLFNVRLFCFVCFYFHSFVKICLYVYVYTCLVCLFALSVRHVHV